MTPGSYNLNIYRGDSQNWRFQLWSDAAKTVPIDLTGMTVKAEIRDRPGGSTIVPLTLVVTPPNIIDASLTPAETQLCPASGKWDLQLTETLAGRVTTVLMGSVKVDPDITDSTGSTRSQTTAPPVALVR